MVRIKKGFKTRDWSDGIWAWSASHPAQLGAVSKRSSIKKFQKSRRNYQHFGSNLSSSAESKVTLEWVVCYRKIAKIWALLFEEKCLNFLLEMSGLQFKNKGSLLIKKWKFRNFYFLQEFLTLNLYILTSIFVRKF